MERSSRQLLEAGLAFTLFAAVSYLGRSFAPAFHLMGAIALALPLVWGWRTGRWEEMGFTAKRWRPALLLGLGAGFVTSLMGTAVVAEIEPPADLALQLALGVPMSLLLASPFQEFFFRGWLQPRFAGALGDWGGTAGHHRPLHPVALPGPPRRGDALPAELSRRARLHLPGRRHLRLRLPAHPQYRRSLAGPRSGTHHLRGHWYGELPAPAVSSPH